MDDAGHGRGHLVGKPVRGRAGRVARPRGRRSSGSTACRWSKGETYRFGFTVSGTAEVPIRALVQMNTEPWTSTSEVGPTMQAEPTPYEVGFTSTLDWPAGQVVFQVGGAPDDWRFCVDDVSVHTGELPAPFEQETATRVRVNQLGLPADRPQARVAGDRRDRTRCRGSCSTRRRGGRRRARRPRAARTGPRSENVHVDHVRRRRRDRATASRSSPTARPATRSPSTPDLYADLATDALGYFYLARSGIEIDGALRRRRVRARGRAPGRGAQHRGHRRRLPGAAGLVRGLDLRRHVRRARRLVRRGRPRQVRGQRRDRGAPGARHVGAGARRAGPRGGRGGSARPTARAAIPEAGQRGAGRPRRGPLGARVDAADAGAGGRASTRAWCFHKVQDDGWTGLPLAPAEDAAGPSGAPAVDRGDAQPRGGRGQGRAAVGAVRRGVRREPAGRRRATAWAAAVETPDLYASAARRQRRRRSVRRQGRVRRVLLGGRRAVPDHGRRRVRRRRDRLPGAHRGPRRARSRSTGSAPRPSAGWTSRWCPASCPTATRCATRWSTLADFALYQQGKAFFGQPYQPVRRAVRVGLQRDHPQQRGDPGGRRGHHGRRDVPRRPRWRASTTCWAATRSTSPTSPATAPSSRRTSTTGRSPRSWTRRCRTRRPAPCPAAPTARSRTRSPRRPGRRGASRSAATWTTSSRGPPTR